VDVFLIAESVDMATMRDTRKRITFHLCFGSALC
jgi:hypothetical protein